MNMRTDGAAPLKPADGATWPYCAPLHGVCLTYDMGCHLGRNTLQALLGFLINAEEGSRLIIQRSRTGFTVQVTGAVVRGEGEHLRITDVQALRAKLTREDNTPN